MSEQIHARVSKATKRRWEEHKEQSDDYDALTDLIRHAVNEQIARDKGEATATTSEGAPATGANAEQMDTLVETVERMSNRIETLEDSVNDATRAMRSGGSVSEETTTAVFEALPTSPVSATTAEGVAEGLDAEPSTVRVALESLHDNMGGVVQKREVQEINDSDGMLTIEDHRGREVEVGGAEGFKRRNPLWWRRE
jgi:DNA-binding protein YbaB